VEEKSSNGYGTTRFGHGLGICGQTPHGFANFVFRNGHNVVHEFLDMLEVNWPDTLSAQSIGDGLCDLLGGKVDDMRGAQAGLGVGREFRFYADHVDRWLAELDCGRHAADHPATANRREHGFDGGEVFQYFKSHGPLTGDDLFVVVGRNDDVPVLRGEFFRFELAFETSGTDFYDLGTQGGRGLKFDGGSISRHHDDGLCVKGPRGVGDALCVVAAGIGNHSAAAFFVREGSDLVVGAAQLEGANRLQIFEFQEETTTVRTIAVQELRVEKGCPYGNAL